jgi:uncharacterized protein YciI
VSGGEQQYRVDLYWLPIPRCKPGQRFAPSTLRLLAYFLVTRAWGPAWDPTRPRRAQDGWEEHAAFMDELVDDGFVILGGPVGDVETGRAVNLVEAESEEAVRERLASDPWPEELLMIERVEPWTLWLRSGRAL